MEQTAEAAGFGLRQFSRAFRTETRTTPAAFHPEEDGRILVEVHHVVRDLTGAMLADEHLVHRFSLTQGLIQKMEVCPSPSSA